LALPEARRVLGANTRMLGNEAGMIRLELPAIAGGETRSLSVRLEPRRTAPRAERPRMTPRQRYLPRKSPPWWQFWKR
jgi:hypothetical protein